VWFAGDPTTGRHLVAGWFSPRYALLPGDGPKTEHIRDKKDRDPNRATAPRVEPSYPRHACCVAGLRSSSTGHMHSDRLAGGFSFWVKESLPLLGLAAIWRVAGIMSFADSSPHPGLFHPCRQVTGGLCVILPDTGAVPLIRKAHEGLVQ